MAAERTIIKTQVGIVGGGPAGLMLSHLLAKSGIDNVVVEKRDHETIRTTHRAGILEHGSVRMLVDSGVSDRVLTAGYKHEGIDLRFGGESHRIDFADLVGESVWLYPQNEVFVDLAAARERDGGEVHYSVSDTEVLGPDHRHPEDPVHRRGRRAPRRSTPRSWSAPTARGGICKWSIPQEHRTDNFVEYPFAWFGILVEAPPSAEELIYCNSERGFALISQRDDNVQRMYFQCPTRTRTSTAGPRSRSGTSCSARLDGPDGFQLKRGHIFDKMVLRFRSYVCEPLRYGNLFLAGDAGHTVPPTGAKGLNLAFADVRVLFEGIESWASTGSRTCWTSTATGRCSGSGRRRTSPTG